MYQTGSFTRHHHPKGVFVSRVAGRVVGCVVSCVLAFACGRKTDVRPPDLVAPLPVGNLTAANTTDGIELRWKRPTRYADQSHMLDLAGFVIERRPACCGFVEIQRIDVGDRQRFHRTRQFHFTDSKVEAGETYFYRVIAFTVDDYRSAPAGPVEIQRNASVAPGPAPSPAPARAPGD